MEHGDGRAYLLASDGERRHGGEYEPAILDPGIEIPVLPNVYGGRTERLLSCK